EALVRSSRALLFLSVLFYLLAILSKENVITLPALALALTLLVRRPSPSLILEVAPFYALCGIIAIWIFLRELGQHRPIADLGAVGATGASLWLKSVLTQTSLFFRYLFLWFVPYVGWMSIDLQYPLARTAFAWRESAGLAAFCLYPVATGWLLL